MNVKCQNPERNLLSVPAMYDEAQYECASSSGTLQQQSFIRACPNKPTRLVFGHGNNYLERARRSLQDFYHFSLDGEDKQRLQSMTVFPLQSP